MGCMQLGLGNYKQLTTKKRTKHDKYMTETEEVVPQVH
jgi:hypothetical protein